MSGSFPDWFSEDYLGSEGDIMSFKQEEIDLVNVELETLFVEESALSQGKHNMEESCVEYIDLCSSEDEEDWSVGKNCCDPDMEDKTTLIFTQESIFKADTCRFQVVPEYGTDIVEHKPFDERMGLVNHHVLEEDEVRPPEVTTFGQHCLEITETMDTMFPNVGSTQANSQTMACTVSCLSSEKLQHKIINKDGSGSRSNDRTYPTQLQGNLTTGVSVKANSTPALFNEQTYPAQLQGNLTTGVIVKTNSTPSALSNDQTYPAKLRENLTTGESVKTNSTPSALSNDRTYPAKLRENLTTGVIVKTNSTPSALYNNQTYPAKSRGNLTTGESVKTNSTPAPLQFNHAKPVSEDFAQPRQILTTEESVNTASKTVNSFSVNKISQEKVEKLSEEIPKQLVTEKSKSRKRLVDTTIDNSSNTSKRKKTIYTSKSGTSKKSTCCSHCKKSSDTKADTKAKRKEKQIKSEVSLLNQPTNSTIRTSEGGTSDSVKEQRKPDKHRPTGILNKQWLSKWRVLDPEEMEEAVNEQLEKYQKYIMPVFNKMIRSELNKMIRREIQDLRSESKQEDVPSPVASVRNERNVKPMYEEMAASQETKKPKLQNRRFSKRPVKISQSSDGEKDADEDVKTAVKGKLKMYLEKTKLSSENDEAGWVVRNIIGASATTVPEYYVCDVCEFYDCFSLKCMQNHERTHRKPRYSCDICTKTFYTKTELNIHEKAVHACVECSVCGWRVRKGQLVPHMRRHFPTKHVCSPCNKEYIRRVDLVKHLRKYHTDVPLARATSNSHI